MKNLYQYLGVPDGAIVGFFAVSLIVLLIPYTGGANFGLITIPSEFPSRAKKVFQWLGPSLIVIAILSFIPFISSNPQSGTSNVAESNTIEWSEINDPTALVKEIGDAYRVYLEFYTGIVSDESGFPRCHVYFGKSKPFGADGNDMILQIQPKPLGAKTPSLMAFVVRDLNDYYKLVDIDLTTGMPKETKATKLAKTWAITNYKKGERLKIVLFVIPDSNEGLREFNLAKAEDIIDANINKK